MHDRNSDQCCYTGRVNHAVGQGGYIMVWDRERVLNALRVIHAVREGGETWCGREEHSPVGE